MAKENATLSVEEGNALILEFVGYKVERIADTIRWCNDFNLRETWHNITEAEYHTSWDWLMPVAEKIEATGATFWIMKGVCIINVEGGAIWGNNLEFSKAQETRIMKVWVPIIEYIEYYNTQKQNS